jgi:capsid protein
MMHPLQILAPSGRPARELIPVSPTNYYEGAQPSYNRTHLMGRVQSARADVDSWTRTELVRKSRHLHRNDPVVHGVIERLVTYTIGCGLTPFATTSNDAWNNLADQVWADWVDMADLQSRTSFSVLQSVIMRSILVDGEIFALLTHGRSGRPRIQLIESHHVRGGNKETDYQGIRLDSMGRPEAYLVWPDKAEKAIEVPADQMVHFWIPERAQQYRGLPILAAGINTAHDYADILDFEMVAVKDHASRINVVKTQNGEMSSEGLRRERFSPLGAATGDNSQDGTRYYEDRLGADTLVMKRGDEFVPFVSNRPSPAWQGFIDHLCNSICLTMNLPPSVILPMKVGGADTRRDLAAAQRVFEQLQNALLSPLERIRRYVLMNEIQDGRLLNPPSDWRKAEWQTPPSMTVDSGRDRNADREDVKAGLLSLVEYFGRYGSHWKQELEKNARAAKFVQDLSDSMGVPVEGILNIFAKAGSRELLETFGLGVRAGGITPTMEDEDNIRTVAGLPPMNAAAREAWKADGGFRRPITLAENTQ